MEEYYFLGPENQRKGPLSLEQLLAQPINGNTLIWKKGLTQWTPAKQVPEVAQVLDPTPAVTQHFSQENLQQQQPCPPTNLVWAILSTVLCCLPLGVIAIIYSTKVEKHYRNGNYAKAVKASESAANWCIASITISLLINLGFFGIFADFTKFAILLATL